MPTLEDYRNELTSAYLAAHSELVNANAKAVLLEPFFESGVGSPTIRAYWHSYWLSINNAIKWIIGDNYYWYEYALLNWLELAESSMGGAVDMNGILNAMLVAKFEELEKFIGIEDAYRCALWDAPFNVDFYAALARGFKKW